MTMDGECTDDAPQQLTTTSTDKRRRALLIGSPLELTAIENDLESMDKVLQLHGFVTTKCCQQEATTEGSTRQGILHAIDTFIQETLEDDVVVLYYSGHGQITESDVDQTQRSSNNNLDRSRLQFIVPRDFLEDVEESSEFKGITDFEISHKIVELSEKTENVTTILDCCHSTRMARAGATVKSLHPQYYNKVSAHIKKTANDDHYKKPLYSNGNPKVVRLAAAEATEPAYEDSFPSAPGTGSVRKSVFTEALVEALQHVASHGIRMSWDRIMLRIKDRVLATMPGQHPNISGPSRRFCFETDTDDHQLGLPVSTKNGVIKLHGGKLHGVSEKDTYAIVPTEVSTIDQGSIIAEATVTSVRAATATLDVTWNGSQTLTERGAHALLKSRGLRRSSVIIQGNGSFIDQLSERIEQSRFICVGQDFPSRLALVKSDGGLIVLEDDREQVIRRDSTPNIENFMTILEELCRAKNVLSLQGAPPTSWPLRNMSFKFALAKGDEGHERVLQQTGDRVEEGQSVYFEITNNGGKRVHVCILDICLHHITVVNDDGTDVSADSKAIIGQTPGDDVRGLPLSWPENVPTDRPIKATTLLVLTKDQVDLRYLDSGSEPTSRTRKGGGTELMSQLDQIFSGGDRVMSKVLAKTQERDFGIWAFEYELAPIV